MENEEVFKNAKDLTEAEWRELTEKTRQGWGISAPKQKPRIEKHARDLSESEWRRELDKLHTKGR